MKIHEHSGVPMGMMGMLVFVFASIMVWLRHGRGRLPEAGRLASRIHRYVFAKGVFLEVGAAILLFGSLVHHPELDRYGATALEELQGRGYEIPTGSDPVRVYPAITDQAFSATHAGGWRPGVISLREAPQGTAGPEVFLRHELMHEVTFRTCGGKLPVWAEEAAAISFSGEPAVGSFSARPTEDENAYLRRRIGIGARLDQKSYDTLSRLVAAYGWPSHPCSVSEPIEKILSIPRGSADTGFSHILINVLSGRVLEARGDLNTRYPPGSLLKVPYAAALADVSTGSIGDDLARSDTTRLLQRRGSFDLNRYRLLISLVRDAPLGQAIAPEELRGKDERFWRRYLGERDRDGHFSFEANLPELAGVLRFCLLSRPERFAGLSRNGVMEGSTLYPESQADKAVLGSLQAMAKTGTVADERGNPLVGHLMVAWPADAPVFLAVFRDLGASGAANLRPASKLLAEWSSRYPVEFGKVRVGLLTLTPRDSWQLFDDCPSVERESANGWRQRVSVCGRFHIRSTARGSRSERMVSGLVESSPDGRKVVLTTDPETYADAVLSAEAQDLRGEALKALRAVIVWNGIHGNTRHHDSESLCDTTHCMVFRGNAVEQASKRSTTTDPSLLRQLEALATARGWDWLPFSKGGIEKWEKPISVERLQTLVNEPAVLELRRERTRSGEVMVHLVYAESEETVTCEVFRNRLKLLSCPDVIRYDDIMRVWVFAGIGEGHGQGLSVDRSRALGEAGKSAASILADAYED
jgi:hypothetical protein